MKITIGQTELRSLLERVAAHVAHTGPLSRVLLRVEGDRLIAVGGNEDVIVRANVICETEGAGAVALPAAVLRQYVANLPPGPVVLDATLGGAVQILSDSGASASMIGVSAEDYPEVAQIAYQGVMLPGSIVHAAADWVPFAASTDQDRPVFTGVSIRVSGNKAEFMATDAHRLARATFLVPGEKRNIDMQVVLSVKSLEIARKLLDSYSDVEVGMTPEGASHLGFRQDGIEIIARAIDGTYPAVERFIPSRCQIMASVDRQRLLDVLHRMVVLTNSKTRSIELRVRDDHISFNSQNYDLGRASDRLTAKTEGGEIEIFVNGEHLSKMIARLPEGRVVLGFDSPEKPVLIRPSRESLVETWTLDYVLMPLRPM